MNTINLRKGFVNTGASVSEQIPVFPNVLVIEPNELQSGVLATSVYSVASGSVDEVVVKTYYDRGQRESGVEKLLEKVSSAMIGVANMGVDAVYTTIRLLDTSNYADEPKAFNQEAECDPSGPIEPAKASFSEDPNPSGTLIDHDLEDKKYAWGEAYKAVDIALMGNKGNLHYAWMMFDLLDRKP